MSFNLRTQQAQAATPAASKNVDGVENSNRRPYSLDDKGVLNILAARSLQNLLRNGGLWFAQRQAPATLTTYSNTTGRAFTADGWAVTNENASIQYIRADSAGAVETGLQARFYGTFSKITSTGKIVVSQCIEGTKAVGLRGRVVRFQVLMKASAAKTIKIAVLQLTAAGTIDVLPATFISAFGANGVDPTLGANLAFLAPKGGVSGDNCTAGTNAFSCSVTTAWQRFGGVVTVPSDAKNVIVVAWTDTQFVAADSFSIAQATLVDGYEIQDWSPQDFATELQFCQRFYCKTYEVDTNPSTQVLPGALRAVVTKAATALGVQFHWRFPVVMRGNPTVTLVNPVTASNAQPRRTGGTAADETAAATANVSSMSADITATDAASGAVGDAVQVQATADAEL